jgi:ABC-2 type transport system permease protein
MINEAQKPAATIAAEESTISDLSYRNYDGPLKSHFFRWWVVMMAALRLTWKNWWFFALAAIPLLRFLGAGFWVYMSSFTSLGRQQMGLTGNFIGEPEGQKYALHFWSALCGEMNSTMALIIVLVIGAGCIASDNRANALLVYLAKPITRADYLIGKWMGIFVTIFSIYLFPAALLFVYCAVSYRDEGFLKNEPWLAPRMLLALVVPALVHSSLIIGISAWSKSARIVAALYASLYILSGIISFAVASIMFRDQPEMKNLVLHFSLPGLIGGITQNIMHIVVPAQFYYLRPLQEPEVSAMPKLWPLLTIAATLVVGSLAAAWAKIRAVEVVRN